MTGFNSHDFYIDENNFPKINVETEFDPVDMCGIVKKMRSKRRFMFSIGRERNQLEALVERPPKNHECYKMLSVSGGFSILGVIAYVAKLEPIEELHISTFRIGKNHFNELLKLHDKGKLKKCHFITSATQVEIDSKSYKHDYFSYIEKMCKKVGWDLKIFNNHSKILLMKTDKNYYVVETSSNLNENPKTEQFSWENDKELYDWYLGLFKELLK